MLLRSERWIETMLHRSNRCIVLDLLVREMLADVDPAKRDMWDKRLRGVDNAARGLYDRDKVNNDHNDTSSCGTQTKVVSDKNSTGEGPMPDEEE